MTFPAKVDAVRIYAGDTTTFPTYVFLVDGEPEDLSGYQWAAQWRRSPDAAEAIDLALDVTQLELGKITPSATGEQTEQMTGNGVWDLQSTLGAVVRTRLVGATTCQKDVTRLG